MRPPGRRPHRPRSAASGWTRGGATGADQAENEGSARPKRRAWQTASAGWRRAAGCSSREQKHPSPLKCLWRGQRRRAGRRSRPVASDQDPLPAAGRRRRSPGTVELGMAELFRPARPARRRWRGPLGRRRDGDREPRATSGVDRAPDDGGAGGLRGHLDRQHDAMRRGQTPGARVTASASRMRDRG